MIKAIKVLNDLISTTLHEVVITSIVDNGDNTFTLLTTFTFYLKINSRVTINNVDYIITDFTLNESLTVKPVRGTTPVTSSSFIIDAPTFRHGTPKMVNSEHTKSSNTNKYPFIWVVEFLEADYNDLFDARVKASFDFDIFFLTDVNYDDWLVKDHYTNAIYPMLNELEFFVKILKKRQDLFGEIDNHKVINHVNFGDYIINKGYNNQIISDQLSGCQLKLTLPYIIDVCEFSNPIITKCLPVSIYENGTFKEYIESGGTFNYISGTCLDATIVNSDESYTNTIASGSTLILSDNDIIINNVLVDTIQAQTDIDLTIEDVNGNTVNTNYNNGVIITPELLDTTIYYNRPLNLQTTSYIKYDEAWYNINNWDTYTVPLNGILQEIDRTNEHRLIYNNSFGHKWRFTGINGGYYNNIDELVYDVNGNESDWDTEFKTSELIKGYIIDNLTGIGYIPARLGAKTYDDIVTILDGYVANGYQGYNDWKIPSLPEFEVLKHQPYNYSLKLSNKTPFNYSQNQWTCTIYNETSIKLIIVSPTTARYRRSAKNTQSSGNLNLCRYHFS